MEPLPSRRKRGLGKIQSFAHVPRHAAELAQVAQSHLGGLHGAHGVVVAGLLLLLLLSEARRRRGLRKPILSRLTLLDDLAGLHLLSSLEHLLLGGRLLGACADGSSLFWFDHVIAHDVPCCVLSLNLLLVHRLLLRGDL